mgnify:CR=1 FL=1
MKEAVKDKVWIIYIADINITVNAATIMPREDGRTIFYNRDKHIVAIAPNHSTIILKQQQ